MCNVSFNVRSFYEFCNVSRFINSFGIFMVFLINFESDLVLLHSRAILVFYFIDA